MTEIFELRIDQVFPDPTQPRKYFNEERISELARSIEKHGLLEPILVRRWNGDNYQIVHGERRYRACKLLGFSSVRAEVKELSDEAVKDIQLTENLERDDLTDIELAWEFERRVKESKTHQDIADRIGKSRAFVTQRIALLQLPEREQQRMLRGELSFSNARLLLSIKDPNIREQVSSGIDKDTPVSQTLSLLKPEKPGVTRVTTEAIQQNGMVSVKDLATYELITNNERVPANLLIQAYAQDLKRIRGF